jgi:hypothetical protein
VPTVYKYSGKQPHDFRDDMKKDRLEKDRLEKVTDKRR